MLQLNSVLAGVGRAVPLRDLDSARRALSSLLEPVSQDLPVLSKGVSLALVGSAFVPDLLLNLAQVIMFRKYGFVASIVTRIAFYLVWHVGYGNFICAC